MPDTPPPGDDVAKREIVRALLEDEQPDYGDDKSSKLYRDLDLAAQSAVELIERGHAADVQEMLLAMSRRHPELTPFFLLAETGYVQHVKEGRLPALPVKFYRPSPADASPDEEAFEESGHDAH